LINKFGKSNFPRIGVSECGHLLTKYGFSGVTESPKESTLSLFEANQDNNNFYIKVAPSGILSRENLDLQAQILRHLYPQLNLITGIGGEISFLAVQELEQQPRLSFLEVDKILNNVSNSLLSAGFSQKINGSLRNLLELAPKANTLLFELGSINLEMSKLIDSQIKKLNPFIKDASPSINHGDASNANCLSLDGDYILIDWEDVMIGFNGFDQIYWLTFLDNVNEIKLTNLEEIPVPIDIVNATFFVIVLLKEYLAHINNKQANLISPQLRLERLMQLPKFGER
jgi:Phosphotransferase enzyme family